MKFCSFCSYFLVWHVKNFLVIRQYNQIYLNQVRIVSKVSSLVWVAGLTEVWLLNTSCCLPLSGHLTCAVVVMDIIWDTFHSHRLTKIRAWISKYIHCCKWSVITNPCFNVNGCLIHLLRCNSYLQYSKVLYLTMIWPVYMYQFYQIVILDLFDPD